MYYALVALAILVFAAHLVFLDRTQRFRLKPFEWRWRTFSDSFYRRELYAPDARGLLRWVYWSGAVWLLLILLVGLSLNGWELWRLALAVPVLVIAALAVSAGLRR
jgi:hypothetical protein